MSGGMVTLSDCLRSLKPASALGMPVRRRGNLATGVTWDVLTRADEDVDM